MTIYVKKIDGKIEQFEDGLRQAIDLDRQIQGEDFGSIYDTGSLPDEDKLSLGLITQKEIDDKKKSHRIALIKGELSALDTQAIRPLRAVISGKNSVDDIDRLAIIESQVSVLRKELNSLEI